MQPAPRVIPFRQSLASLITKQRHGARWLASASSSNKRDFAQAVTAKDGGKIWTTFSDLKTNKELQLLESRSCHSLSKYVAWASNEPYPSWPRLRELAFFAACRGYSEGLLACFRQYLAQQTPKELLFTYAEFRKVASPKHKQDANTHVAPEADSMQLLFCAITACAMLDSFNLAFQISIETPLLKLPLASLDAFIKTVPVVDDNPELAAKVNDYVRRLHTARLVARSTALESHVRNLARDNKPSALYDLWAKIADGLRGPQPWIQPRTQSPIVRPVILEERVWPLFMSTFYKLGRPDLAKLVWETAAPLGIAPTIEMWESFLSYYCSEGSFQEAVAIWSAMKDLQVILPASAYTSFIRALRRAGRLDEAMALLNERRNAGQDTKDFILPMCNYMLDSLYTFKRVDEATRLFESMVAEGPLPTVETYNAVLKHYKLIGGLEGITSILNRMAETNIRPDVASCTIVVDALIASNHGKAIPEVLKAMTEGSVASNVNTCSVIIRHLLQNHSLPNLRAALDILVEMESPNSHLTSPNVVIYTQLIEGHIKCRDIRSDQIWIAVEELLQRMVNHKIAPNAVTYEVLYKGAIAHSKAQLALSYFQRQVQQGIGFGDNVACILLAGFMQLRELGYAHQVLEVLDSAIPTKSEGLQTLISKLTRYMQGSKQKSY
jgi:pentatricopeptide repeat protein